MSAKSHPHAGKALIDRLPQDRRDDLIQIGREALQRFSYAYQQVFDEHLHIFEFLAAQGATATMIGKILAEVGRVREDDTALPAGTVSSALSRARERATRRPDVPRHGPAQAGMDMPAPASPGNALHHHADQRKSTHASSSGPQPSTPMPPGWPHPLPAIRPSPNPSAGTQLPAATSRAAALLEQLRSDQDD